MRVSIPSFIRRPWLAALVLVVVTIAWAASYPRHAIFGYDGPRRQLFVQLIDGELSVLLGTTTSARRSFEGAIGEVNPPWLVQRLSDFVKGASLYRDRGAAALGFGYVETSFKALDGGATTQRAVWLPLWSLWLPLAAVVAVQVRRPMRIRRRRRRGWCVGCGYDLRGSSSRCPECGRAIEEPPLVQVTR